MRTALLSACPGRAVTTSLYGVSTFVHIRVACNEKFARKSFINSNHDTNPHEFVFEMEPWSFMAYVSSVCFSIIFVAASGLQPLTDHEAM